MATPLEEIKAYLTEQYLETCGLVLDTPGTSATLGGNPIWVWQDGNLHSVKSEDGPKGAVVLDGEVGLCMFLQTYDSTIDLSSQINRILAIKSELLPRRASDSEGQDKFGEWSTSLLWLCDVALQDAWIAEVAKLRNETAYFEEISVDILVNGQSDWATAAKQHGLPRLLLQTRGAIRREHYADAVQWLNADSLIKEKIEAALSTSTAAMMPYAKQVLDQLAIANVAPAKVTPPTEPAPLLDIEIVRLRNLSAIKLPLREPGELVGANIVQGPNGTGKSAVSEAISIALGNVSTRYIEYLEDTNDTVKEKAVNYLHNYLSPINSNEPVNPTVRLNGKEHNFALVDESQARSRCSHLSGTLLSQSWAEHLTRVKAETLGAEIAGSYSAIASGLVQFLEDAAKSSEDARASFNREWGLRSNVSRDETARAKIANSIIESLVVPPNALLSHLSALSARSWQFSKAYAANSMNWQDWAKISETRANSVAKAKTLMETKNAITAILNEYYDLQAESGRLADDTLLLIKQIEADCPTFIQSAQAWSQWLHRPQRAAAPDSDQAANARLEVTLLQNSLDKATRDGTLLRNRLTQVELVSSFVGSHWASEHPDQCPICDSNVSDRGGIETTIRQLIVGLNEEVIAKRAEFGALRERLGASMARLSDYETEVAPLSTEQQSSLQTALSQWLGMDTSLDALESPDFIGQLGRTWDLAQKGFLGSRRLTTEEVEHSSETNARKIYSALERFAQVSEAPEQWKILRSLVFDALAKAIDDHLPRTIQALWLELSRCMMPAPWQYPGELKFSISQRRTATEARLHIAGSSKSGLAAHVLNTAELHNLGLGWFFARYLTHGRYFYSTIVLDDPAGQMDEPTFRDFCRFSEALLRLHRVNKRPLTYLMFLHQDDRALSAARTINGTIHYLRWHKGASTIMTSMRMREAAISTPLPFKAIAHKDAAE